MNTSVIGTLLHRSPTTRIASRSTRLSRSSLIVVCVAAMAIAAHVGAPSTLLHDDPELAHLLRGMALIKATIALAAVALSWWRFRRPTPRVAAAIYIVAAGLMVGATISIWQLSSLLLAAVVFHLGLFALLVVAWLGDRDAAGRGPVRWLPHR